MSVRERSFRRRGTLPALSAWAVMLLACGCNQNPYLAGPGGTAWQAPGTPVSTNISPTDAQIAELTRRVQLLDDNNRQLHTQLAQSEQQGQVYRDELNLVREQLAATTQQFESTKLAARDVEKQVRGMQASTQLRGSATITPNTNLGQLASRLNLHGVPVRQSGDVIRITIPADQLFQPGSAQLLPQASLTLDPIAAQLRSIFPRQRIGIEGYTDNSPQFGGQTSTGHQLASAQAAAVLDMLTRALGCRRINCLRLPKAPITRFNRTHLPPVAPRIAESNWLSIPKPSSALSQLNFRVAVLVA